MSDLVQTLRDMGYPCCEEAADEIERLRAALREIVDCHLDSTRRWAIARAALGDRT